MLAIPINSVNRRLRRDVEQHDPVVSEDDHVAVGSEDDHVAVGSVCVVDRHPDRLAVHP